MSSSDEMEEPYWMHNEATSVERYGIAMSMEELQAGFGFSAYRIGMNIKRKAFKAWIMNLSQSRPARRAFTDHELSMFGELINTWYRLPPYSHPTPPTHPPPDLWGGPGHQISQRWCGGNRRGGQGRVGVGWGPVPGIPQLPNVQIRFDG